MRNDTDDPTLRIEEIAMAKMIKAKAAEIGSPVANLSLTAIVKAHRIVMAKLGFKRKGQ
jgi:hypothetical protein